LNTLIQSAVKLCDADKGSLERQTGTSFQLIASYGFSIDLQEFRKTHAGEIGRGTVAGRTILEGKPVQVQDVQADPEYTYKEAARIGGVRTALGVPLMREGLAIGVFFLSRTIVRPFTESQISLVSTFADQAVIAMENARLVNELRQRTMDLTEALEQQTATSELLQVISSCPGDLDPIFATMLANAIRICDATFGDIFRWEDGTLRLVTSQQTPAAFAEMLKRHPVISPGHSSFTRLMLETKTRVHIADLSADPLYLERNSAQIAAAVDLGGVRTVLAVPMFREEELIGEFILNRQQVCPFTEKQIELVENFAAQAVIAIENARLLNELRQRTDDLSRRTIDLTEALEWQTATSEVLQVISSSPGDLDPVFTAMLANAVRISGAKFGIIHNWDGEYLRLLATYNLPPALEQARKGAPEFKPGPKTGIRRMVATKGVVHIPDLRVDDGYREQPSPQIVAAVEQGGVRTMLVVPMLKENDVVGTFTVYRQEVRDFTDKQIELVKNFAAQAVIAIENTRLLKELRERTQEVEKLNQRLEQRVADQVGEIERMGRLRRFLPSQVADLIVASGSEKQLESHRREITALFCDLRGFTGFTESADAEDVMALLREYHAAIGEKINKYSGTLERYAGDGVMIVFNDPVPVENPALQAVLMGLELRDALGALTSKWRRFGHDIGFGIGIAHGYATLGTIGFEGRFDYAAIGTVSNVASRLCDEAKPGQILISPRVLVAVEDTVKVEPVGEFELKGIRRPLAAYNVLSTSAPTSGQ
jgi:class 3 adenylate cyclase/putative methionine-R-sulfoxide reductase with GAF domain